MTKLLYMDNSYLKEFEAKVTMVDGDKVVLNQTAFYPLGGGLPNDVGYLVHGETKLPVTNVYKDKVYGEIVHVVPNNQLKPGDTVKGVIDWDRRYRVMRMHTALHILIALLNERYGVLVTGNQVKINETRVDVNLEKPDKQLILDTIEEANNIIGRGINVKIYYLPREEAMKIPGIVKLARALPPKVDLLRIVEIPGVDIQADGGPHVANTKEIGKIVFKKLENKGRNNRRIRFTLEP